MNYPWLVEPEQQWLAQKSRLHHAWLLSGPEGVGLEPFALRLAAHLLCEKPGPDGMACGHCAGCHLQNTGLHPDFVRLSPEVDADGVATRKYPIISVDQVRGLVSSLSLTAHRAGYRVVLIEPADALQTAAANALLKTLEEPPPQVVFFLLTHQARRLLPTIRSRCRQLVLASPSSQTALNWLQQQGLPDAAAHLAYAGGGPLAALSAAQDAQMLLRRELLAELLDPARFDPLACARKLDKSGLEWIWQLLSRWVCDVLAVQHGGSTRFFVNEAAQISVLAPRFDPERLFCFYDALCIARRSLQHPLQARLVLEDWFWSYRQCLRKTAGKLPAHP